MNDAFPSILGLQVYLYTCTASGERSALILSELISGLAIFSLIAKCSEAQSVNKYKPLNLIKH